MIKALLIVSFCILASCTSEEPSENDSAVEPTRTIDQIDDVEFLEDHPEAEYLPEEEVVSPEKIDFDIHLDNDSSPLTLTLLIDIEESEELTIGSTHFRFEYLNGEEWEEIDGGNYGAEDAQVMITSNNPFEFSIRPIEDYETELSPGQYRLVNSGYAFPFSIDASEE